MSDYDSGIIASGALFLYLKETQKTALSHMASIRPYSAEKYMLIDSSSRRNLELVETMREKQKTRFSSLGTGQDQNSYGSQNTSVLCGTASDRCRGNRKETGCSGRTE